MTAPRDPNFFEKTRSYMITKYASALQTPLGKDNPNLVKAMVESGFVNCVTFAPNKFVDQFSLHPTITGGEAFKSAFSKHPFLGFTPHFLKGTAYLLTLEITKPVYLEMIQTAFSEDASKKPSERQEFVSNAFAATSSRAAITPLSFLTDQINFQRSQKKTKQEIRENISKLPIGAFFRRGSLSTIFKDTFMYPTWVGIEKIIEPQMPGTPEMQAGAAGMLTMAALSPFNTLVSLTIGIERSRNVSFREAFNILCKDYTVKRLAKCNALTFFSTGVLGGSLSVVRKFTEEAKAKAEEEQALKVKGP